MVCNMRLHISHKSELKRIYMGRSKSCCSSPTASLSCAHCIVRDRAAAACHTGMIIIGRASSYVHLRQCKTVSLNPNPTIKSSPKPYPNHNPKRNLKSNPNPDPTKSLTQTSGTSGCNRSHFDARILQALIIHNVMRLPMHEHVTRYPLPVGDTHASRPISGRQSVEIRAISDSGVSLPSCPHGCFTTLLALAESRVGSGNHSKATLVAGRWYNCQMVSNRIN